jgi:hypothetical protein
MSSQTTKEPVLGSEGVAIGSFEIDASDEEPTTLRNQPEIGPRGTPDHLWRAPRRTQRGRTRVQFIKRSI